MEYYKENYLPIEKLYLSVTKDKFLIQSYFEKEGLAPLSVDIQERILDITLRNPVCKIYPPPLTYRKFFLRILIGKVEDFGSECADSLVEAYTEILAMKQETNGFYSYKIDDDCIITLKESSCFVSNGTTGLQTWEASKYLAEWCLKNKILLENKTILELGCGIGLLGLVILKLCSPKKYTFSDNNFDVLKLLSSNIDINIPNLEKCAIEKHQLAWSDITSNYAMEPDVILGADIVFDIEATKSLVSALKILLTKPSSCAYIASTLRNPETNEIFLSQLVNCGLKFEQVPFEKSIFVYDAKSVFLLYKICNPSTV